MARQIEKRYMKFEDFLEKYAWHGDERFTYRVNTRIYSHATQILHYKIRDHYTKAEISVTVTPEEVRKLVNEMNKEEFAHLKRIYDICFVKYKK